MTHTLDYCMSFLKRRLTSHRFTHSLGVMEEMGALAEVYGLKRRKAVLAGLLHDTAKDMPPGQLLNLAQKANIQFRHMCERHPLYIHGPVSAYLASQELKIGDRQILDAISAHTYCDEYIHFHAVFNWCLRFADFLEPSRTWPQKHALAALVYSKKLKEGALFLTARLKTWFEKDGLPIHPNIIQLCDHDTA
jgi:predicted HD superfamily hydrolase involved in NAD metabolism